jgi:Family of unknown function (DUF5677)
MTLRNASGEDLFVMQDSIMQGAHEGGPGSYPTTASTEPAKAVTSGDDEDVDGGLLFPLIVEALAGAVERGLPPEDALAVAPEVFAVAMPKVVKILVTELHRTKVNLLRDLAADRDALTSYLEEDWGTAFGAYETAAYAMYEFGGALHDRRFAAERAQPIDRASDADEIVLEVLSLLHGRACTVAQEVLWLLRGGYADGAAARQRTLHELAVVLTLITEDTRNELAGRYLDYAVIEQREDLRLYQIHAATLGQTPLTKEETDSIEAQFEDVLQRRGTSFRRPNQWAEPLFPGDRNITFGKLETKAGLGHLRPYYRQSNHAVHAGPRAAVLNLYVSDRRYMIGAGARANVDFAEIAHASLISLFQCSVALVPDETDSARLDFLVQAQAIEQLVEDAGTAFGRAARRLPA